jgi:hypothetical protein
MESEIFGLCGMCEKYDSYVKMLIENPEGKRYFEHQSVGGQVLLMGGK